HRRVRRHEMVMSSHDGGPGADVPAGAGHDTGGHGGAHDGGHAAHGPDRTPWIVAIAWTLVLVVSVWALREKPDAVPFIILLLPRAAFPVLCLFGDAIRNQGEGTGAAVLACCTTGTSFLFALASVVHLMSLPAGPTGLRFTQPALKDQVLQM